MCYSSTLTFIWKSLPPPSSLVKHSNKTARCQSLKYVSFNMSEYFIAKCLSSSLSCIRPRLGI